MYRNFIILLLTCNDILIKHFAIYLKYKYKYSYKHIV